jgi:hypothetical protein
MPTLKEREEMEATIRKCLEHKHNGVPAKQRDLSSREWLIEGINRFDQRPGQRRPTLTVSFVDWRAAIRVARNQTYIYPNHEGAGLGGAGGRPVRRCAPTGSRPECNHGPRDEGGFGSPGRIPFEGSGGRVPADPEI